METITRSNVLEAIDNVSSTLNETSLDVLYALSNSYGKAVSIMENYNGYDLTSFSIFTEAEVSANAKKEESFGERVWKKDDSVIWNILAFLPRLVIELGKSIVNFFKGDTAKKGKNAGDTIGKLPEAVKKLYNKLAGKEESWVHQHLGAIIGGSSVLVSALVIVLGVNLFPKAAVSVKITEKFNEFKDALIKINSSNKEKIQNAKLIYKANLNKTITTNISPSNFVKIFTEVLPKSLGEINELSKAMRKTQKMEDIVSNIEKAVKKYTDIGYELGKACLEPADSDKQIKKKAKVIKTSYDNFVESYAKIQEYLEKKQNLLQPLTDFCTEANKSLTDISSKIKTNVTDDKNKEKAIESSNNIDEKQKEMQNAINKLRDTVKDVSNALAAGGALYKSLILVTAETFENLKNIGQTTTIADLVNKIKKELDLTEEQAAAILKDVENPDNLINNDEDEDEETEKQSQIDTQNSKLLTDDGDKFNKEEWIKKINDANNMSQLDEIMQQLKDEKNSGKLSEASKSEIDNLIKSINKAYAEKQRIIQLESQQLSKEEIASYNWYLR